MADANKILQDRNARQPAGAGPGARDPRPADGRPWPAARTCSRSSSSRRQGDRIQDRPLSEIGGKGLFTLGARGAASRRPHRSRRAFVQGHADGPARRARHLRLPAARGSARRLHRPNTATTLTELPQGAVVGSSSLRRQALIRRMRPDLKVVSSAATSRPGCASWTRAWPTRRCSPMPACSRLGMADVVTDLMDPNDLPAGAGTGRDLHREPRRRSAHRRSGRTARSRDDDHRR